VHGSILHIFMNMSSLFSMGPMLESQFGSLSFFIMY
jgi:membrane associated rhomboid family serine protease